MRQRDVIQRRYETFEKRTEHFFQEPTRENQQSWEHTFSQLFYEPWVSEEAEEKQERPMGRNARIRAYKRKKKREEAMALKGH